LEDITSEKRLEVERINLVICLSDYYAIIYLPDFENICKKKTQLIFV
jgi:hypothetical protein